MDFFQRNLLLLTVLVWMPIAYVLVHRAARYLWREWLACWFVRGDE